MKIDNEEWLRLWRGMLAHREPEETEFAKKATSLLIGIYRKRGCPEKEVKDMTQSCLVKLFENNRKHLRQFNPERGKIPVYLSVVAVSHYISQLRRPSTTLIERWIEINTLPFLAGLDQTDSLLLVNNLLEKIQRLKPPKDRAVMLLHIEGLKDREIVTILGMEMGSVATCIRRARSNLRKPGLEL